MRTCASRNRLIKAWYEIPRGYISMWWKPACSATAGFLSQAQSTSHLRRDLEIYQSKDGHMPRGAQTNKSGKDVRSAGSSQVEPSYVRTLRSKGILGRCGRGRSDPGRRASEQTGGTFQCMDGSAPQKLQNFRTPDLLVLELLRLFTLRS